MYGCNSNKSQDEKFLPYYVNIKALLDISSKQAPETTYALFPSVKKRSIN
jgi:hypothetical protein